MKKRRLSSPKRNNQQASNSSTNFPMEVDQSSNLTVALRYGIKKKQIAMKEFKIELFFVCAFAQFKLKHFLQNY